MSGAAFCTIVAKNYLAYARALGACLRRHHPDLPYFVLVVDEPDGFFDPGAERFDCVSLGALDVPRPRELCFRYEVIELATAVKPWLIRHLFEQGVERAVYLDPDVWVYRPLEAVLELLEHHDVVLTPHLTSPLPDDGKRPGERDFLLTGAYNLGFLALTRTPAVDGFLQWWSERCETGCLVDPPRGLFVDQRWVDLVPGMLSGVHVLRDPGYNVAYWNLHERRLSGTPEAPRVNGEPLCFFHFSGLDPLRPASLSRHQNRYERVEGEPLAGMVERYSAELIAAGHQACARWPYGYGALSDGHPIGRELRQLFREQPAGRFPDPFDVSGGGSFLRWALTPEGPGPPPLAARLHSLWRRLGASAASAGRGRLRLPLRGRGSVALEVCPAGLAPLARQVLSNRPDVQSAYQGPAGALDRVGFLRWLAADGVAHHGLKLSWCLEWLGTSGGEGITARLIAAYDRRPEIQRRLPMAFVEEHDAPAFQEWVLAHAAEIGLESHALPAVRRLFADQPARRVAQIYRDRPDVQEAFPEALGWPGDPAFLAWLRYSGRNEYGVTEDWVLWFERARAQHACRRLHRLYETRSDWRERHPLAFSPLGSRAFLEWLRASGAAAEADVDVGRLERLCPLSPARPVEELRLLHAAEPALRERFPRAFQESEDTGALVTWVRSQAPARALGAEWLRRLEHEVRSLGLAKGATVIGYLQAESGMGEIARSTFRSLCAAAYPVAAVSLDEAPQRQADRTVRGEAHAGRLPYSIVHVNGPEALRLRPRLEPWLRDRCAVGYWAWELGEPPPEDWTEAFGMFAEVWTCSRHAAAALAAASPVPVQAVWPALPEVPPSEIDRGALGLDPEAFVFLFAYDLLSETERKNPLGLIEAFRRAFRADDRVQLVLKASNGDLRPADLRAVADAARGLPVVLLPRYLDRRDVLGLMKACDAYVSLHRCEGFGLTLAEAMALGKPVVATYYSGNVDFMTPWNCFPVPYRLVEIEEDRGPYRKGAWWADPDLEAAAALLRAVRHDREAARRVADRGREDVMRLLSPAAVGRRLVRRLSFLSGSAPDRAAP